MDALVVNAAMLAARDNSPEALALQYTLAAVGNAHNVSIKHLVLYVCVLL